MRPLTLHVSALSDSEYDLYTRSLNDLASDSTDANTSVSGATHVRDDAYYERTSVGVREARAWLRGRYSDLPASDIDAILRLFCPNMLHSDTLTGGQFFAAFRLVIHARSGKGVDRTLAFVQASPKLPSALEAPRSLSPPKRPVQAPPSHPDRQKTLPLATSHAETNPFTRKSTEHATAPVPTPDPAALPALPQQHFRKISHNPFLARDKPDIGADKTVPPPVNTSNHGKLPPLPPRKPSLLAAPPRRPSEAAATPLTSTANIMTPSGPPLVPTKPTHVMSPLMKQSLEASKHAQSMKRAEEQLDQERVLQVLKTTSSSPSIGNATPSMRTRSLSPSKQLARQNGHGPDAKSAVSDDATCVPPLPRRRKPSLSSSASSSVLSLEQVASAKLPSPVSAPFRPPLPNRDMHPLGLPTTLADNALLPLVVGLGPIPPPTHPRRRPSTSTEPTVNDSQSSPPSSPRVARSKSVTSTSSVLPPPPRRKRPESMQLTLTSDIGDLPAFPPMHAHTHTRTASSQGLSRHLSLSREREREPSDVSPISNIQRTLTHLQLKAQPRLDAVRYKAEAGISRRGYVHHTQLGPNRWREEGEQGLMTDTRWAAANVDQDPDSAPTTDEEPSSSEDRGQRTTSAARSNAPYRDFLTESDNLKWPMGEGWKPL